MLASTSVVHEFAALTERELEVLRLLAAGHTVKSIAASLGRSEASVNERLRDARRKTGVGSSRELARRLAEQKIWDRKIDLPPQRARSDGEQVPIASGHRLPKGTIVMLIAIPFAAAGLVLAASSATRHVAPPTNAHRPVAGASPLVGRWSLDVSRIPAAERPRQVTIDFRLSPDQKWTTTVDIVGPDGSTSHAESTAATDGIAVPITGGMASINAVSLRQPAPNTLVMTLGKDGVPVSTRVYTVAGNRRSMTETIVWASGTMPKLETTYFTRVDAAPSS